VIGMTFTALIPKIDLYSYFFTLFITPMFLFSGIFFPLDRLPDALQAVAWFTPLYHLVNLMRELATGPALLTVAGNALWLALLTLLLFALPVQSTAIWSRSAMTRYMNPSLHS
jgi:lipooligosaccharide transport system permease protein